MSSFRNEHFRLNNNSLVDCTDSASASYGVKVPAFAIVTFNGNAGDSNSTVFIQPSNYLKYGQYKVVNVVYSLDGNSAAASVLDIQIVNSGTDLANGTTILNANVNINTATLKTPAAANLIPTVLSSGQSLGVILKGTLTGLVNLSVTFLLERV